MGRLNKLDGWRRACLGFLVAWIWVALIATAMTVAIPTITFAQTSGTATESEPVGGGNASPVQDTSGTEGDSSVETDPPDRSATPGAVAEEMQSRFNELRSELLDDRAGTIEWWLAAMAVVLTFFGIVVAIAGFLGFKRFREIETEARNSVGAAKQHEETAKGIVERIETLRSESEERVQHIRNLNAEAAAQNPNEANQAVQDARENPKASLTDKAIANALDLQQQGRNKEALEKWRAIARVAEEIDKELAAQAEFSVGYLLRDEDPEGSISAYDKSIRLKPDNFFGYNNRGIAKGARGRYEAAIADFDQAIRLKPDYATAFINRGNAKGALGRHEDAIADYDQAIRLAPDLAGAYSNRGNAKGALGRHEDAIADYDQAIRLEPDYAKAYYNRGSTKSALGRHEDAIADYEQAIRLKPDFAEAYHNRGNAKGQLERHEDAIADFDEAIRLKPDNAETYSNRGNAKGQLERHEDAIADFDEAIRLKSDFAGAYHNRGVAKEALGRQEEAQKDFKTALGLARNAQNAQIVAKAEQSLRDLNDASNV